MKHKPQPGVPASQVIPREAAVRQIDPICDALADACRRSADRAERRLLARRRVPAVTARASRGLAEGVPAESSGTLVAGRRCGRMLLPARLRRTPERAPAGRCLLRP